MLLLFNSYLPDKAKVIHSTGKNKRKSKEVDLKQNAFWHKRDIFFLIFGEGEHKKLYLNDTQNRQVIKSILSILQLQISPCILQIFSYNS